MKRWWQSLSWPRGTDCGAPERTFPAALQMLQWRPYLSQRVKLTAVHFSLVLSACLSERISSRNNVHDVCFGNNAPKQYPFLSSSRIKISLQNSASCIFSSLFLFSFFHLKNPQLYFLSLTKNICNEKSFKVYKNNYARLETARTDNCNWQRNVW